MNAGIRPRSRIDTALAASAHGFTAKRLGVTIVNPFSATIFSRDDIAVRPCERTIEIEVAVVRTEEPAPSASGLTGTIINMQRHAPDESRVTEAKAASAGCTLQRT